MLLSAQSWKETSFWPEIVFSFTIILMIWWTIFVLSYFPEPKSWGVKDLDSHYLPFLKNIRKIMTSLSSHSFTQINIFLLSPSFVTLQMCNSTSHVFHFITVSRPGKQSYYPSLHHLADDSPDHLWIISRTIKTPLRSFLFIPSKQLKSNLSTSHTNRITFYNSIPTSKPQLTPTSTLKPLSWTKPPSHHPNPFPPTTIPSDSQNVLLHRINIPMRPQQPAIHEMQSRSELNAHTRGRCVQEAGRRL